MKLTIALVFVILAMASLSAGAQNLLTNGGFESGNLNSWTSWYGSWGSGGYQATATTADKVVGNYAAKLTCVSGSWGLYQQVTVTAGTRYKVDGYWKGSYGSGDNWFEVLLIDGAFSMAQASNSKCNDRIH